MQVTTIDEARGRMVDRGTYATCDADSSGGHDGRASSCGRRIATSERGFGLMKLKRTKQCAKCPWRVDVDPNEIPNGYCPKKHADLSNTIAKPGDLSGLFGGTMHIMACHETHDAHCVGWLMNQLGPGNNIGLRLAMRNCENIRDVKLVGEQHECFEDTLPDSDDDDE
jgi:hypothetical protein